VRQSALACAVALLAATSPSAPPRQRSAIDRLPRLFVWAWERPEDLRDLDEGIGVAFLAQTISITRGEMHVAPRRQALRVSPATALVAVTRIEIAEPAGAASSRPSIEAMSSAIARTAALPRVAAVQIDFDAAASDRAYYRGLIRGLRGRLAPAVPISITALASWCAGDDWLGGLPIDEAVPMLFRMGAANEPFRRVALSRSAAAPACRGAVGLSLDEPLGARPEGRRVYTFSPQPWSGMTLLQARQVIR
jgi:hypothetical protein